MTLSRQQDTLAGQSHLIFDIGSDTFAIATARVSEIIEFQELTRVPTLPRCVRGVTNLRGTVLPVLDLALKFGSTESPVGRRTCVIVVEVDHEETMTLLGVMTDCVYDVLSVTSNEIEPAPAFGAAVDVAYLDGMIKYGERFALLLNTGRVLSLEELLGTRSELRQEQK